jgi:hypothetical protein
MHSFDFADLDDRAVSPYTGWTRRTWEALADRTLLALRPYASPGHALIQLPGPASRSGQLSDGLEGFARSFLLAGFRLARSGDQDTPSLAEWYAAGLAAGTDPDSPERWPRFTETRQAKVEAASIAIALHETRPWIWDRLDDAVRERIIDWFAEIIGDPIWDNNWTWFQAVIEAFLRSVGGPWSAEDIDRTLERTERWYVGDGWYSDGTTQSNALRNFDYYSGWAMHFYPLWYCRIAGLSEGHELTRRYRSRLVPYLDDARHLVAANGAPLYQGRSLTYRFAMLAPFWTGAVHDSTPLSPGQTRRLANGVVKHFIDAGAYDDENELLTLGWHRAFPRMRQLYSGPGSPYWASKAFAGLVLPEDHPVWTATEQPLPIEEADFERTLLAPGWLVSGTKADGIVRVAAHGPDHAAEDRPAYDVPEYARYGYSTHTAPDTNHTAPQDSHIALLAPDGRPSHRRPNRTLVLAPRTAVSRSRVHWLVGEAPVDWVTDDRATYETGPILTTASLLHGPWEVRLARVDAAEDEPQPTENAQLGPLVFYGWLLASDAPFDVADSADAGSVQRADGVRSVMKNLHGLPRTGTHNAADMNPLGRYTTTPWLMTDGPAEYGHVYAALVVLSGTDVSHDVDIRIAESSVTVTWPDGEHQYLLLL